MGPPVSWVEWFLSHCNKITMGCPMKTNIIGEDEFRWHLTQNADILKYIISILGHWQRFAHSGSFHFSQIWWCWNLYIWDYVQFKPDVKLDMLCSGAQGKMKTGLRLLRTLWSSIHWPVSDWREAVAISPRIPLCLLLTHDLNLKGFYVQKQSLSSIHAFGSTLVLAEMSLDQYKGIKHNVKGHLNFLRHSWIIKTSFLLYASGY